MKLSYRDLGHGITCIEAHFQRPNLACCYLLEGDGEAALIDTGTHNTVPSVMELLEHKGLAPHQVKYVIPTHVHLDHAGGAGELMERLPEARLLIHPFGARHMPDPAKLIAGATAVYGEAQFERDYGTLIPIDPARVTEAGDGLEVEIGGRTLVCLDTPGHARHHICLWDPRSRGMFTGDTFGIAYPELTTERGPFMLLPTTPVQFDPEAWHQTIDRLMEPQPERMYLTHYCSVENPTPLAAWLHRQIDDYVAMVARADPTTPYAGIYSALLDYHREALRDHGCSLDRKGFDDLLAMDIGLCAQGLEVWLQRNG
ncbi:MAG: MBL fold metallo-hydrolase [Candidatus Sedimenticola endophacoides]